MMIGRAGGLASLALLVLAAAAAAAPTTLTPEMLVDLERVDDVALDRAGSRIAFVLAVPRSPSDEPGAPWSELWAVPAGGGAARRYSLEKESASAPAFSSDGKRLYFLSKPDGEDATTQIHAVDVDGGAPTALTSGDFSVLDFRLSPDDRTIALVVETGT